MTIKRVIFVSQSFYPSPGGVSTLILNLANLLVEVGVEVHVLHFEAPVASVGQPGLLRPEVKLHPIPISDVQPSDLRAYAQFKELIYLHLHGLQDFDFDTVEEAPGYTGFQRVNRRVNHHLTSLCQALRPDVVHFQDYQVIECVTSSRSCNVKASIHAPLLPSLAKAVRSWLRECLANAQQIVLAVPAYAEVASRFLPAERLSVLPPLPAAWAGTSTERRVQSSNSPKLLCVQRFDHKSGHEQLVSAFAEVHGARPDTRLTLVGGPSFTDSISSTRRGVYEAVREQVNSLRLMDAVAFAGTVDYGRLSTYYREHTMLCHLSKMECFGLAVTEAMSCALPVIVTAVGGLAYQVEHDVSGLVVPVGELAPTSRAILRLIDNTTFAAHLGRQANRRFVERFSHAALRESYIQMHTS